MLADLDRLMSERGIGTVIVPMHEAMHPSFRWLTRGAKVTRGYAVKPVGRDPVLVTYPMEREEAAATGLEVVLSHALDEEAIFRAAPSASDGTAELFDRMLRHLGAPGPVALLGNAPLHLYLDVATAFENRGWTIHKPRGEDLIQLARKRKEPREVAAIRSVGERTEHVVDSIRSILREAAIDGDTVLHKGRPLTIGALKEVVSHEIARLGMIEDHETILSQGRDAGVPHSRGDASAFVKPSVPLVLDIFPADKASGYFFDLTRTFCIGSIPDTLRAIHADVLEAFCLARNAMRPGTPASSYQALVCDFFESKGFATLRSDPKTLAGYVHGLGHGVGLEVHEMPSFKLTPSNRDAIETGDIVTIEPGLYFPDREIGVRIEDTFLVTDAGVESLCRGSYALEP